MQSDCVGDSSDPMDERMSLLDRINRNYQWRNKADGVRECPSISEVLDPTTPSPPLCPNLIQPCQENVLEDKSSKKSDYINIFPFRPRTASADDKLDLNVDGPPMVTLPTQALYRTKNTLSAAVTVSTARKCSFYEEIEVEGPGEDGCKRKLTSKEKEVRKEKTLQEKKKKQLEREKKKIEKEKEKAMKKAEMFMRKTEKLDECLKNVTTILDPKVVSEDGASILKSLEELGTQYDIKSLPVPSSIGWMRTKVSYSVDDNYQITRRDEYIEESDVLIKMKALDFVQMALGTVLDEQAAQVLVSSPSLHDFIAQGESGFPSKRLTFLVQGMGAHFKKQKAAADRRFINRVRKTGGTTPLTEPLLSRADLEQVLVSTQLRTGYSFHFCETPVELGNFVAAFTKAVAERPFKKRDIEGFSLCGGVSSKPTGSQCGSSVQDVWVKQLQQFNNVSYDIAAAIVVRYPCPKALYEAYRQCQDETTALSLLQDIEVRRGHGSLATTKRVGPELSRKLFRLFTATDAMEMLSK